MRKQLECACGRRYDFRMSEQNGDGGFAADGYAIRGNFISAADCERYLSQIREFRRTNEIAVIDRPAKERSLRYSVINGAQVAEGLAEIQQFYLDVNTAVNRIADTVVAPLRNPQVGVNINITQPGGEYRWHYDRNRITAILYLNSVEGGETEFYPNYRLMLDRFRYSGIQHRLDSLLLLQSVRERFGRRILFKPEPGSLLIMRADRCLHSVRPVLGDEDRVNIVMAYDTPDKNFAIEDQLDAYLYRTDPSAPGDPNYK